MPSSSSPFVSIPKSIVIDDDEDDDFDWDAAIREIDSTCAAGALASGSDNTASMVPSGKRERPSVGGFRQATLECFMTKIAKTHDGTTVGGNQVDDHTHHDGIFDASGIYANKGQNVSIDLEAAKTWVYPSNVSHRDYQFSITEKALYSNTMVVLPTGLGKTLIAAVVMYNYFRWFPEGKIVFTAPSRPLVMQQIEACHKIVGMPQELTIDMTGNINPRNRIELWKAKRVFFVTPQVLEKDIQTGICLTKKLVCLVIDEAHRASGNYSYCVVLRELMSASVELRILALTATPGSKHETVQNVINNLCISTLEYRDENNHDVSKYINDRKSEFIKVPMDKGVDEILSLLIQIMRPTVNSLNSKGVLPHRDCTVMTPSEWINIKTKFGNEVSTNFGYGEKPKIMSDIGMMVMLSHIRLLLLGYGIRLAYVTLEEKLKGSIAKLCNNELIRKAQDLMSKHLSHGAPCPKLSKLIELLKDHFESKNSKDSRVMIFSSFRESVRHIIDSLCKIGGLIKVAEFIGQSSGNKSLKGQSQKTQQAVLEKFRSGEYNVIVSTSIGEEGLDIIEVDLVICFDANISSLRMTQRMGRTGRKNSGRFVILAYDGHEVNGYLRKQATGKVVKKQMLNGGVNNFEFLPSPRMVPHCCKPKLHIVEFSVDEFIHFGRKTKVIPISRSLLSCILSTEENDTIYKYFHHPNEDNWKPSLIAFPHFQTFPSKIHRVGHSMKTIHMFINAMQHLQMFPSSKPNEVLPVEEAKKIISEHSDSCIRGVNNPPGQISYFEPSSLSYHNVVFEDHKPEFASQNAGHQFLFKTNFVSVSTLGEVIIASFPTLPSIEVSDISNDLSRDHQTRPTCLYEASVFHYNKKTLIPRDSLSLSKLSDSRCSDSEEVFSSQPCIYKQKSKEETCPKEEIVHHIPLSTQEMQISKDNLQMRKFSNSILPVCASASARKHFDSSPKFNLFSEKRSFPESSGKHGRSVSETNHSFSSSINHDHEKSELLIDHHSINFNICSNLGNETFHEQLNTEEKYDSVHALDDETNAQNSDQMSSQVNATVTLNKKVIDESLKAIPVAPKFKRLRKSNDIVQKLPVINVDGDTSETYANSQNITEVGFRQKRRGLDKKMKLVKSFIEEEADVSIDADVSEDEEDDKDENIDEFNNSFIDDRSNPSEASAHEENSVDMVAFYRRSLLTQSPLETPSYPISSSHEEVTSTRSEKTDPCAADEINNSILTPRDEMNHSAKPTADYSTERINSFDLVGEAIEAQDDWSAVGSKKRKLSHQCPETGLVTKMQPRDLFQSNNATASSVPTHTPNDLSCDDAFFENLDLDALEAQAIELLKNKPKSSELPACDPIGFPSFDLGL